MKNESPWASKYRDLQRMRRDATRYPRTETSRGPRWSTQLASVTIPCLLVIALAAAMAGLYSCK